MGDTGPLDLNQEECTPKWTVGTSQIFAMEKRAAVYKAFITVCHP